MIFLKFPQFFRFVHPYSPPKWSQENAMHVLFKWRKYQRCAFRKFNLSSTFPTIFMIDFNILSYRVLNTPTTHQSKKRYLNILYMLIALLLTMFSKGISFTPPSSFYASKILEIYQTYFNEICFVWLFVITGRL